MHNFEHAHSKIIEWAFSFPKFAKTLKKIDGISIHSWDIVNVRAQWSHWPQPFLTMLTRKIQLLTFDFCQSVSTCKKLIICSGDMAD